MVVEVWLFTLRIGNQTLVYAYRLLQV
uniref:Uncharacterized protein n=1 Tax=Anguilla anguilla TaxID=7936 RepID=A0A0E9RU61_ANGAN